MHFKYVESFISRVHSETKLGFYEWYSVYVSLVIS